MLKLLRSSRGVVDMGVGMFLAASFYHFLVALVGSVLMPLLTTPAPSGGPAPVHHPMVASAGSGHLLQATLVLILSLVVAYGILRWTAGSGNSSHQHSEGH